MNGKVFTTTKLRYHGILKVQGILLFSTASVRQQLLQKSDLENVRGLTPHYTQIYGFCFVESNQYIFFFIHTGILFI